MTNSGRTVLFFKPIECECEFCFRLNWRPTILSSYILQYESAFRNRILALGKTTVRPCLKHVSAPLFPNFVLFLIFVHYMCNFVNKYFCVRILLRNDLVSDWRLELHVKITHVMSGMYGTTVCRVCAHPTCA